MNLRNLDREEEVGDGEEALSLRDLPITGAGAPSTDDEHLDPPPDQFEFLSSSSDDISPAEDLIFRGRLIPLNAQIQNPIRNPNFPISKTEDGNCTIPRVRVRSESLPSMQSRTNSRDSGEIIKLKRHSRSLDYRKLNRNTSTVSSDPPESDHKLPELKRLGGSKHETTAFHGGKGVRKPKWYAIMFGMIRIPPEIEMRDIKSRQIRRNLPPSGMFTSRNDRSSGTGSPSSSWRLLKALSCKEPTSVSATTPFWVPHA